MLSQHDASAISTVKTRERAARLRAEQRRQFEKGMANAPNGLELDSASIVVLLLVRRLDPVFGLDRPGAMLRR